MELVHVHDKSYVIKMNGNTNAKNYGDSYRQVDEFYDHHIKQAIQIYPFRIILNQSKNRE